MELIHIATFRDKLEKPFVFCCLQSGELFSFAGIWLCVAPLKFRLIVKFETFSLKLMMAVKTAWSVYVPVCVFVLFVWA